MRSVLLVAALSLAACSSAPEKKAEAPPPAPAPVKDDTALLPTADRTDAKVVTGHLLGIQAWPGGTIGDYEAGGRKYQLFIIESDTAQDAALLLLDAKNAMKDPAYISYMGGYFGALDMGPLYVFAKTKYLAGVVGLSKEKADPIARQLAAQLR
jgi:hypothetical protein